MKTHIQVFKGRDRAEFIAKSLIRASKWFLASPFFDDYSIEVMERDGPLLDELVRQSFVEFPSANYGPEFLAEMDKCVISNPIASPIVALKITPEQRAGLIEVVRKAYSGELFTVAECREAIAELKKLRDDRPQQKTEAGGERQLPTAAQPEKSETWRDRPPLI